MGPTWGPSGADRTQVGPMLARWTLLSGIPWIKFMSTSYEIGLRWMPQNIFHDKSIFVQVMTWCIHATIHYLSRHGKVIASIIKCGCWSLRSAAVEAWKWIRNFISHFIRHVITYAYWNWSYSMLAKRGHWKRHCWPRCEHFWCWQQFWNKKLG